MNTLKRDFLAVGSVEGQRIEMIEMPNEDDGYGFQNHKKKKLKAPFVIEG